MNETEEEPLMTTRQVANILGVHINTVRRWDNQGLLKACRISPRGDRRFRREDIHTFLIDSLIVTVRKIDSLQEVPK